MKISRFERIGTGTFGNVYRGELLDENRPLCVAIKVNSQTFFCCCKFKTFVGISGFEGSEALQDKRRKK
jgi:hypothetical protein